MRYMAFKSLPLLSLFLLLSACAGSVTPPARYMLPSSPMISAPTQPQGTLQLRPPRLAHYLDVDGIVMQLNDITLNAAREHQWAESLGRQLERSLRSHLAQELTYIQVIRDDGNTPNALTLSLEVDQFQGRYDGVAIASGQWQLRGTNNELLALEGFTAETELDEDGYPALVRALGKSWHSVASQIANQIRQGDYF
ncbi:PqiC family protein [Vreelandella olivaria]|uniref:PqiC family protein n=1 Tax=Vreelandella olivaria TaxID=390919 RepID=UPI00201EFD7F|nr:ABC-type transport auxiliary lipoprotein family protein [Halomonas olivaria]